LTSSRLSERLSTSRRRSEPGGRRWVRVAMAVLATIGVIDTGSITLKSWGVLASLSCSSEGFLGCNGCEKVLASAWGSLFGQPLSLFGFLAYGAILVLAVAPLVLPGELRVGLGQRSWWGLFLLSTAMAVFSAVLIGVMVVGIRDCCPFCILSALLSLSLFVLSLIGADWQDSGQVIFRGVIAALVVGLVSLGWAAAVNRPASDLARGVPPPITSVSTPQALALAEHLTSTGAVMYSAYWCPHCNEQKQLFGKEAAARLRIVECAPDGANSQKALCDSKQIEGFPTWEINGRLDSGVKPLTRLAELSGFRG
jgi:uncharacterized membrane protein/glutaredoxin